MYNGTSSADDNITYNEIFLNGEYGVYLGTGSDGVMVHHNNFLNNFWANARPWRASPPFKRYHNNFLNNFWANGNIT